MADDRFVWYAWMTRYYLEMSIEPGFGEMDTNDRWAELRERIVSDNPESLNARLKLIDEVPPEDRAFLLKWFLTPTY